MTQFYIGISALHHDSAAALIDDKGNIICISQEERRSKIKNDKLWPHNSIDWCIKRAKLLGHDIDESNTHYGFYEKPYLKFTRRVLQNPKNIKKYYDEVRTIHNELNYGSTFIKHHEAHALSGCATAPFDNGVFLTIDAIGEWNTTSWGTFNHDDGITVDGTLNYPNSLGILYSSFTRWLGLKPNEDEYIVMGAAAYGKPKYTKEIYDKFIEIKSDGTFKLKHNLHRGIEQFMEFECPINQWYDWCASIQQVTEDVVISLVTMLEQKYGTLNLVLSGGVALNCVINTALMKSDIDINDIWILPSPGDSGNALGAACAAAGLSKLNWVNAYLGDDIDNNSQPTDSLLKDVSSRLQKGEIIGWIQGCEEFGPRSLGHRSIIADPTQLDMQTKMNEIKRRQQFRPFAPSVLAEEAYKYFDMVGDTDNHNYMQFVSRVRNPEGLPAISHINDSARVQTVPKSNDSFRRLLEYWHKSTDCAVLVNTSFNIKGQPLISSRSDAITMLLETKLDCVVIGNIVYYKVEKHGLSEDGSATTIVETTNHEVKASNQINRKY